MSANEIDDRLIGACAGPRRRFNWAAALLPFWLLWRRLYGWQLLAMLLFVTLGGFATPILFAAAEQGRIGLSQHDERIAYLGMAAAYAALGLAEGFAASTLLRLHATRLLRGLRAGGLDDSRAIEVMRKEGRGSPVGAVAMGFGALFVVLTIIQFPTAHHHPMAYRAAMKSDLRNLATVEESYFADHGIFMAAPEDSSLGAAAFRASIGVTVTMGTVTSTGWNATARHVDSREVCGIFVGTAPSPINAPATEYEPVCGRLRR